MKVLQLRLGKQHPITISARVKMSTTFRAEQRPVTLPRVKWLEHIKADGSAIHKASSK